MEHTSYWIWNKRKFNGCSSLQASSYIDSWVEQAFAQYSSNPLGGCIWPPRSYSCNFCNRKFMSAQALGGHMNAHRRDRARLKQSTTHSDKHHLHYKSPCTIFGQYPSNVKTLVYPNPNFPSSSSRLSPPSITSEQILVSSQHLPKGSLCSTLPLLSNFIAFKVLTMKNDSLRAEEMDYSKSNSMETCEDDEASSRKKLKNNGSFLSCMRSSASIEDLDLELRLGDRPKV